jgi:hypothetical protein
MSDPLRFIPPRVQLTDPRTGMISREWYLFFQGVFDRIGGATGASTPDIVASLFEDAGSSETNAMLFEVEQATGQYPLPFVQDIPQDVSPPYVPLLPIDNITAELSALQDRVAELVKELDSLKQGTLI